MHKSDLPRVAPAAGIKKIHKRRAHLAETIESLIGVFAAESPGFYDKVLLIDSTPVGCARSVETVRRPALGEAADYGYCVSHSRFFSPGG
ncbi:MAG TPA: hypothetical protein VND98_03765 [Solirubrobacterales bacterium]|nr:hypothetical protein [Solirubrobacterales bacterium]